MIGKINFSPKKVSQEKTWKPDPNWIDIEKILAEDTEDYPVKIAVLINTNILGTTPYIYSKGINKIKTSIGEYNIDDVNIEYHYSANNIFDFSSDSNNIQYAILYLSSNIIDYDIYIYDHNSAYSNEKRFITYMVIKGDLTVQQSFFTDEHFLKCIKILDKFSLNNEGISYFCDYYNLEKIEGKIEYSNTRNLFQHCYSLKKIDLTYANENSIYAIFGNCYSINILYIDYLGKINAFAKGDKYDNENNLITINSNLIRIVLTDNDKSYLNDLTKIKYCYSLKSIEGTGKISGSNKFCFTLSDIGKDIEPATNLNLSYNPYTLTRQSMLNLINNMKGTGTITFGNYNLCKLTEDEKQMIIDKGWTYA